MARKTYYKKFGWGDKELARANQALSLRKKLKLDSSLTSILDTAADSLQAS